MGAVALVVATGEHALPHDAAALVALALLGGVALAARFGHPDRPELVLASTLALGVFIVQIGLGGVLALTDSAWARALHVGLGAVSLAIAAIAAAACFRGGATVPRGSWRDYVTLTKPRIMSLLLLTAAGGMLVGARGVPSAGLLAATLGGLALACGGASALNHVIDRDIDRLMGKRTGGGPWRRGGYRLPAHSSSAWRCPRFHSSFSRASRTSWPRFSQSSAASSTSSSTRGG